MQPKGTWILTTEVYTVQIIPNATMEAHCGIGVTEKKNRCKLESDV